VVDAAGAPLTVHGGVAAFTVGQRRGVGVAAGARRYVLDVDAGTATVTVGTRAELLRAEVPVRDLTFVARRPDPADDVDAQVRAHGEPIRARLVGDMVRFGVAQPRVAPGQVVALYRGDELLGGGVAA
jgi:tRNA-specific 2-thiouridylase